MGCGLLEKESMQVIPAMISGKTEEHLCQLSMDCLLHKVVLSPFLALKEAAAMQGYDLQVASAFRVGLTRVMCLLSAGLIHAIEVHLNGIPYLIFIAHKCIS